MIKLRAIKGKMGNTDFYMTSATLGEVARIVNYKEKPKGWSPEISTQRPLNMTRVRKEMVPYLVENLDHFYNALVVEHVRLGDTNNEVRFVPDKEDAKVGWIELEGSETLEALDGQHRLKSIELAVQQMPDLARESIGLVVVPFKSISVSQQLFSDLNRQAKPTPKSMNILFEQRDPIATHVKALAKQSKYLDGRVNLTGSSLSERSPYIITVSMLYEATKIVEPILVDADEEQKVSDLVRVWDTALGALPGMEEVQSGKLHPSKLRATYIYPTGVGFEALAEAIRSARELYPNKWEEILVDGLPRIKWALTDPQWEGVTLFAGRIAIARAARRRTSTLVKYLLGLVPVEKDALALFEAHVKELRDEVYAPLKRKLPSPVLVPAAV